MRKITLGFFILALILTLPFLYLGRNNNLKPIYTINNVIPSTALSQQSDTKKNEANIGDKPNIPLKVPAGFKIGMYSSDTPSARDLQFSPEGVLLVSLPSQGRVVPLPDNDSDGRADEVKTILSDLDNPHGLAFYRGALFVAEERRVARYTWNPITHTASEEKELFKLPLGGRHSTRALEFDRSGNMFVSIGSTCDTCYEKDPWISTVIISNSEGKNPRVFAKGLRNAVFIKIHPVTGELWGTEMGRDYLGDNTPPDEINILKDGKDYGWPICYGKNIHDDTFDKSHIGSSSCKSDEPSLYNIQAHSAPLGLTFVTSVQFPKEWEHDLLVAYHGSWNRSVPTGYKVVHMKVRDSQIVGEKDFITGFQDGANTLGRPVDIEFDTQGSLFISDDKAGAIYKVIYNK